MVVLDEDFGTGLTLVEGNGGVRLSPVSVPERAPRDWRSQCERERARADAAEARAEELRWAEVAARSDGGSWKSRFKACRRRLSEAVEETKEARRTARDVPSLQAEVARLETLLSEAVPSIYSIVPPNDGSALRHGNHFEPVDFEIDPGRGHHDAYSAGSWQRTYARACGCRQRPRRHRETLIKSERGWSGREAFVTMMQTADLGQGNDRSGPGQLNGLPIRCVLAERAHYDESGH